MIIKKINATRSEESQMPLNQRVLKEQQKKFPLGAKSFLVAMTKHLVNRLPLHGSWKHRLAFEHCLENGSLKAIETLVSWEMSGEYVS